ncbi:MAG: hypothetical protein J0M02_07775 [Planctomycetes bacterium]|nr:hypothetical protein [Planctomycetota bacterium]
MRARRGTFLLFCLAAVSLTVVIVFAFLKAVELQRNQAVSMAFPALAQQAALYGSRHAVEELVKDYRREAVATLDAPGRAMFRAFRIPLGASLDRGDAASERMLDQADVAMEARISRPAWEERAFGLGGQDLYGIDSDWFYVAGRGRWFEVEFRNRTDPAATTQPAAVPFPWDDGVDADGAHGDDSEAGTLSADLRSPPAYDAAWTRIDVDGTAASARNARSQARYRLRYAVTVLDLDGALLMNPDPDIDFRAFAKADPTTYAQPLQQLVARHMHAVPPLVNALLNFVPGNDGNTHGTAPEAAQHAFMGRGHGTSFLRDALPLDGSAAVAVPRTWPLMYRGSADIRQHGGDHLYDYDGVAASEAGGSPLPLTAFTGYSSRSSGLMLTGAQASPFNLNRAVNRIGSRTPIPLLMACTPFGRPLSGGALTAASTTSGPYDGWTTTPWKVNVLTAPPAVLRALLYAYMPPGVVEIANGRFRDMFHKKHSDAFLAYDPPPGAGTVLPDHNAADARALTSRYPGQWMTNATGAHDDLGAAIQVSELPLVRDPLLFTSVAYPAAAPGANSFWKDIICGFSNAVAVAKRAHLRYSYSKFHADKDASDPPYQVTVDPAVADPEVAGEASAKVLTTKAFDRLFLACLGIDMADPDAATTYLWTWGPLAYADWADGRADYIKAVKDTTTARATIKGFAASGVANAAEKSATMELVLNDFRLSFFGSDPAYTPDFRPLDFNGDGYATCSAYHASRSPARAGGIGRESAANAAGEGAWSIADILRPAGDTQRIVPFCISGCTYVGRSRYWDVQVRGEVYDNRLKRPVANATLQSVLVIDPEARRDRGVANDQAQTQILFQRWHYDRYSALMARE